MTAPRLKFWYEFASTYSYLAAMRIDAAAEAAGVEVAWQPFLLGPIFRNQGWSTSPFNIYPAKGRYMVRDVARIATSRGLEFRMPDPFPANTLKAARLRSSASTRGGWRHSRAPCSRPSSGTGSTSRARRCWARSWPGLGLDAPALIERSTDPKIKERLRAATAEAEASGIFGAPSFVTPDGELFWGDDRVEAALAAAANSAT